MKVKVLFTRGDKLYVVQKGELFYLIDLNTDAKPLVKKRTDSFLKFGYFTEVTEISKDELSEIKKRLSTDI